MAQRAAWNGGNTYDYNSPTGNAGKSMYAGMGTGTGGFGGHNVGQQQYGGAYAGQLGPQQPSQQQQQFNYNQQAQQQAQQQLMPNTPGGNVNPLSPYPTHSNFAYPGETGEQTNARLQHEYNQRGQKPLDAQWDAQRRFEYGETGAAALPGGSSNPVGGFTQGGGGGAGGGGGNNWLNDPAEAELRRQREIMLQRIDDQRRIHSSPFATELQGSMLGQMRGTNSPYPALTTAQLGENADAGAAAFRREQQGARRTGAASGQSGGGAEYSAMKQAGRRQDANTTQGRRQIQTTNSVLEDQRRERGRAEGTAYFQNLSDNNWRTAQLEADLRSRSQIVGGDEDSDLEKSLMAALSGQMGGMSPTYASSILGGGASYDPNNTGGYNQQSSNGGRNQPITQQRPPSTGGGGPTSPGSALPMQPNFDPWGGLGAPGSGAMIPGSGPLDPNQFQYQPPLGGGSQGPLFGPQLPLGYGEGWDGYGGGSMTPPQFGPQEPLGPGGGWDGYGGTGLPDYMYPGNPAQPYDPYAFLNPGGF